MQVKLTVKSSRLILKKHQAQHFLSDKHTNDRHAEALMMSPQAILECTLALSSNYYQAYR